MKRSIFALSLLVAIITGCQVELVTDSSIGDKSAVFDASTEVFVPQTKTSMAQGKYVVWSAGDQVAIFQGSTLADRYETTESSAGQGNAIFEIVADNSTVNGNFSAGTELPCNVAVYPYSDGLSLAGEVLQEGTAYVITGFSLPETQTYKVSSFGNGSFPMAAVTKGIEDHSIKFKNLIGVIKLPLKGTMTVKSITIKGNNNEVLSGPVRIIVNNDNSAPSVIMAGTEDANKAVSLNCLSGVQLNEIEATDFYISLPPVTFDNGFNVTVTYQNNTRSNIEASVANSILRSSVLVMPEVTLVQSEVESSEDYVDEYNINHGPGIDIDGVVWAPVNCGYHQTDYQWGKLYQWGRKYGQGYLGELNGNEDEIISDATFPIINNGGISIIESRIDAHSNIFYISDEENSNDWVYPSDDRLWNTGTEEFPIKTINDPCPYGWRVPTYSELMSLSLNKSSWIVTSDGMEGYWFSGSMPYSDSVPQVFLPASGERVCYDGDAMNRGDAGMYWTSKGSFNMELHTSYYDAYLLAFYEGCSGETEGVRANGFSVRCVRDKNADDEAFEEIADQVKKSVDKFN